ncbi:MAG: NADPH-dependent F420 reductase [Candidatus Heimdallarchaeota archaeon]|nr:NADPH-dependent F420 reductase [Candidatus Heimdallarchaeota archaeon]
MKDKIGLIGGTGPLGQGLALRWGLAGEPVWMGSRLQEKADKITLEINSKLNKQIIQPMTNRDCIQEADIILIATPFNFMIKTIEPLLPYLTEEKILVDVTVPLKPFEKGKMVDILSQIDLKAQSATELLRKVVPPSIPVVGAFKTLSNSTLRDIDRLPTLDQDVFIFSKDKEAKNRVKEKALIIEHLRPVDAGGTLSARHVEGFTAFLIGLNLRYKTHDSGIKVSGLPTRKW